jgi:hypothetical protein
MSEARRCLNSTSLGHAACCAIACIGLAGPLQSLAAQSRHLTTLFATVADGATGTPLSTAEVIVPDLRRIGRANWLGKVLVVDVPSGVHRVRVRVFGYQPIEVPVAFQGDTVGVNFMLKALPPMLDTVRVTAAQVPMHLQEFESRRRTGLGRYLSHAQLDSAGSRDFETVMTMRFPGLQVVELSAGRRILVSTRGGCGADPSRLPNRYGAAGGGAGGAGCANSAPCPVIVRLDGMDLGDADLDIVRTWDLAGVEYYSGSQVPVRYRTSGSACGVMLLWSKR